MLVSSVIALTILPVALLSTGPVATAAPPSIALLTSVTAQDMGTFDRVTFTFTGGPPQIWNAAYAVGPASFGPSGNPVEPPIAGAARLEVTITNAADEDLSVDPIVTTYPGPFRFSADLPNVTELVQLQDFEATLTWAIGVNDSNVEATARVANDPTRVEVDIPHGSGAVEIQPALTG